MLARLAMDVQLDIMDKSVIILATLQLAAKAVDELWQIAEFVPIYAPFNLDASRMNVVQNISDVI